MTSCPSADAIARAVADPDAAPPELLAHAADCPRCRELLDPAATPVHWEWLAEPTTVAAADDPADSGFLRRLKAVVRAAGPGPAGLTIPGLEIEDEIARGGMGVVYRARDAKLGRTVAVKVLPPDAAPDPDRLARFLREAKALAALSHPNVVRLFAAGDANGRPYLVMEYVPGGTLRRALRAGPWPPDDAARLVRTLADATDAAHRLGIVHRDIKPANVLLEGGKGKAEGGSEPSFPPSAFPLPPSDTQRLQPKLADFGLVRFLDAADGQTATGEVLGTPEFMAPEQALGRTDLVGPATDVWALGVVLYEVLTGRPPFTGPTRRDTLRLVTAADPVSPDRLAVGVSADLAAVCRKCLEKDIGRRYPTAAALRDDLDRFLDGRPVSARPRSWLGWARDRVRRHPLRSLALLGLGLVPASVTAGAAWAWTLAREERVAAKDEAAALRDRYAATAADLYAVRVRLANEALIDGKTAEATALLTLGKPAAGEPDPRGWEWTYLANRLRGLAPVPLKKADAAGLGFPPPQPSASATTPDGRRRVVVEPDGGMALHDEAGRLLLRLAVPGAKILGVHFSADGRWLAARTAADEVVIFDGKPGGLAGE